MDSTSYKAFRIVLMHWITPSIEERKNKAATKLAMWWIRISGSYRGFKLYNPYLSSTSSFPPGLWRQFNCCANSYRKHKLKFCRCFHKRWAVKNISNAIKTLHIQKYIENNLEMPLLDVLHEHFENNEMEMYYNSSWLFGSSSSCACNLMPENVIIDYKERYNSMEHIFRIMASDTITTRTRAQVSLYIQNRLIPKRQ